ncbi:DNA mismatch repair endonuclease MutL [Acetobacterium sp. KB-1]|jgi:DNA mismatch repair protein MutL|uniref:DNA mismatch repair endonuclease MutL n=1 Tax=Acetobacterium sp. KB-1 TaxID=2184575 RepID=UPI000DBEC714|nr:DNA mismatch repair endonuclease MutL [Acetobacterium sp. KB-1]AWW28465.1 DNA mismatch repair endonuclease MutL [Acetobacterium sp. KB-1]
MKIKMLNNETINKIAAGEVIVRPVSVVKELVENAIDAGANQITVIIEAGGKNRITVQDNGCGIAYNEIPLAFKRHATSKLSTIDDLESIESLGFRGEALSSVSAVAKVQITTRFTNEEVGSLTLFEGGKLINQRVCAYNRGTEITVSDLFYNTPARRKHMEKDKKEEMIVRDLLEKIAISHPGVRFQLSCNGRIVLDTPGTGKVIDVVAGLYGIDVAANLIALNYENKPMKLAGLVGNLKTMRNHRDDQVFFINGRYIKNNRLAQALDEAYEGYSMKHQHPLGIIFMTLPGRMLDINIHPAKTEIKILNESLVCLLFKQGIRETLRNTNLIVELGTVDDQTEEAKKFETDRVGIDTKRVEKHTRVQRSFLEDQTSIDTMASTKKASSMEDDIDFVKKTEALEYQGQFSPPNIPIKREEAVLPRNSKVAPEVHNDDKFDSLRTPNADTNLITKVSLAGEGQEIDIAPLETKDKRRLVVDNSNRVAEASVSFNSDVINRGTIDHDEKAVPGFKKDVQDLAKMRIVGQLFNVYILLEGEKEIYLLDQHAAHEAFLTQELMGIFNRNEGLPSQGLMTPIPLKVRPKDLTLIENALAEYQRLGYDCDVFGDDTLLVRSVPVLLGEPQSPDLLKAMIDEHLFESNENTEGNTVFSEKVKNKIIMMACKAAIKGGQSLTQAEIRKLLEDLRRLSNPYTCPHGRPIIMRLKEYELMKLFKRVV